MITVLPVLMKADEISWEDYQWKAGGISKPIHDVNKMFDEAEHWGVTNLKGWVESHESSRFTQIDERSAIITAESNMQYIKEWFMQNLRMDSIEIII